METTNTLERVQVNDLIEFIYHGQTYTGLVVEGEVDCKGYLLCSGYAVWDCMHDCAADEISYIKVLNHTKNNMDDQVSVITQMKEDALVLFANVEQTQKDILLMILNSFELQSRILADCQRDLRALKEAFESEATTDLSELN